MKPRRALLAGLMVVSLAMPAMAQHRSSYGRYANSPVHTAVGVYPYSYSNPAFRAGGGTVAGTDAAMMRQMHNMQMQAMRQQQQATTAQQKTMMAAAAKAKSNDGDKNRSKPIANLALQPQQSAPHLKGRQELARERARKREAEGPGNP